MNPGDQDRENEAPLQASANEMLGRVYAELRALGQSLLAQANEKSLQGTDLVHEAVSRFIEKEQPFENERHFFNSIAQAMRHVLIDHRRRLSTVKRGRSSVGFSIEEVALFAPEDQTTRVEQQIAVLEALSDLEIVHPRAANTLRAWILGNSCTTIAKELGVSVPTVRRLFDHGRKYLRLKLGS